MRLSSSPPTSPHRQVEACWILMLRVVQDRKEGDWRRPTGICGARPRPRWVALQESPTWHSQVLAAQAGRDAGCRSGKRCSIIRPKYSYRLVSAYLKAVVALIPIEFHTDSTYYTLYQGIVDQLPILDPNASCSRRVLGPEDSLKHG